MTADVVAELLLAMRPQVPALVERMQRRIRAELPFYAAEDVVTAAELRTSLRENVDFILDGIGGAHADLHVPEVTGKARAAAGAPLVELLAAYRVGFAEVWRLVADTAERRGDVANAVLAEVAGAMFELHNAYSAAAVTGYRDESQQMLRTTERERAALVEAVLTGTHVGSGAHGSLWEVAQALRLPVDGAFVVVAAETGVGHDPLPRIESVMAAMDVGSVWRLQPDLLAGVVSMPRRDAARAVLDALRRHATGRVGVSPVFPELRHAAWALRLARLACENQEAGGVAQFADSPLNVLVAAAPAAAIEAARAVLGELLDLPPDDRDLLLSTFTAWLDADGSAGAAAAALFCHPNTVRYRLRRVEERTRRSLARPSDVAELVTAVRAWSQLPHS